MNLKRVISGDQSPWWDAVLKIGVLRNQGYEVDHYIQTNDYFRPPENVGRKVDIYPKFYLPDGNVNRRSTTLEMCSFLGRMHLSPLLLMERGANFGNIALYKGAGLQQVVQELSGGDWSGLTFPDAERVVHGLYVNDFSKKLLSFRNPFRQNFKQSFPTGNIKIFDGLLEWADIPEKYLYIALQKSLDHSLGFLEITGVFVGNSIDQFSVDGGQQLFFLQFFLADYQKARRLYNQAIMETHGDKSLILADGQLPFYAVIEADGLRRYVFTYEAGDTPETLLKRASGKGRAVAVLAKVLFHINELRRILPIALPEGGSEYLNTSERIRQLFSEGFNEEIKLHPVVRVRLNALDALEKVTAEFLLPEYLQESFGKERITGTEFASKWRIAVAQAYAEADKLSGNDSSKWVERFLSIGGNKLWRELKAQLDEANAVRNEMIKLAMGFSTILKSITKHIDGFEGNLNINIAEQSELLRIRYDVGILNYVRGCMLHAVDARRAQALAKHLQVAKSLEHWNNRPFAYWITALPGWWEGILEKAEIYQDPMTP